jgi:hypothetical protein
MLRLKGWETKARYTSTSTRDEQPRKETKSDASISVSPVWTLYVNVAQSHPSWLVPSTRSNMLPPPPAIPPSPPTSAFSHDEVPWHPIQVMISSTQLLQVLIINQPFSPQMLKQTKIRPRVPQRLPHHRMVRRKMHHPRMPARSVIITRHRPLAQRALHTLRWLFAPEMTLAMRHPFPAVV